MTVMPDAKHLLTMNKASFIMGTGEGHMDTALNGRADTALVGPEDSGISTKCLFWGMDILADFSHCSNGL